MYRAPRGTSDILPKEQAHWRYVEQNAVRICQLHGYERIDTPVFEDTRLFVRSVGEETEIVTKQMYTFEDKSGSQITLRPEGTAPVCRAYLERGMHNLPPPVKLYYIAPIFRYERPQAGRYRQHYQFGYEAIGDNDPALDAEVIDMARQLFLSLSLRYLSLKLNSIGCKQCRPMYLTALRDYYSNYAGNLCPDCKARLERNPIRLLDCKKASCQQIANCAPRSIDYLCPACDSHFNRLKRYLEVLEIPFELDHHLVRGLDYYTKTVFEIQPETEGAQSALGGGGRYDDLIVELGGKPTPAVGFATGMERIIRNLKEQDIPIPALPRPQVFVAYIGDEAKGEAMKLASTLRKDGIGVIEAIASKSLKAQLRQANTLGALYTVIIGEEEIKSGTVVLRDMVNAEQKTAPLRQLKSLLH